jgi:hypothetical protein
MRRALGTIAVLAVAVAGVIALIAFFNGRDSSTTGGAATAPSPGVVARPGGGAVLRGGNIVLSYADAAVAPALRRLASALGAPDTPELRAAGQAVVLRRDPRAAGIVARAYRHTLTVSSPADGRLQDFIESWLGQGASG